MNSARVAGALTVLLVLGLLVALLSAESQFISLQVWLGGTLAWLIVIAAATMLRRAPLLVGSARPLIERIDDLEAETPRPKSLRVVERAVAQGTSDVRRYRAVLQPRLAALAADRPLPATAADLAWMLDPDTQRQPSVDEIERFTLALEGDRP